jgi:cutinase
VLSDTSRPRTSFITQASTSCPSTKIVLSGYSQGALVLRSTADTLPAATLASISSIVTFGDPRNPQPITGGEGKTLIVCQESDAVCSGGFINVAHLTYGANATVAARFVVEKANCECPKREQRRLNARTDHLRVSSLVFGQAP